MLLTVKYKLRYELLSRMMKHGVTPDSLDQILVMRMRDLLRQNKIEFKEIKTNITRNHGILTKLFEVAIHILGIQPIDVEDFTIKIVDSVQPFMLDIEDINIIILH